MDKEELMKWLAEASKRKIACLNSFGDFFDIITSELIDEKHVIKMPTDPGYYILSEYTCDGSCSIGSEGTKNDGQRCTAYYEECGKYLVDKIVDGSIFMINYMNLEKLVGI